MELTKMQKRLMVAVVVSAISYVVDALFLGPSGASASTDAAVGDKAQASGTAAPTTQRSERLAGFGAPGVGKRLTATTRLANVQSLPSRDIFHPNGVARPISEVPAQATQAKPRPVDPVAEFLGRHKLRAVLISEGQSVALINDRLLRVGQSIGGFKLTNIENKSATLEKGAINVRITLSDVGNITDGSSR